VPLDRTSAWRLILGAAAVAFVLRAAFGLTYWIGKPLTHDEREYLALAESLAEGRGFTYGPDHDSGTAQQFGRAPLYPMFLAAIGARSPSPQGGTPDRLKIVQSLLGAVLVILLGATALEVIGPRAGAIAAIVAAAYPPLVWYPSYVLSETLYSVLAIGTGLLLQRAVDRSKHERSGRAGAPLALLTGIVAGAAILTRPAMLLFVPLALLWLAVRRRYVLAVALTAGIAAVVLPWTARNYRVYDRFVLVASEGGITFWTGNHPLAVGEGDLAANPEIKKAELEFRQAHPGLSAEDLEPLYYRDALAHIAAHPGWWLGLLAKKLFYTVIPAGPSYALHSPLYRIGSIAPYLILLPFAARGVRQLWRSPQRPTALFLLTGATLLVSLIFFPQERFRVPVLDPMLILSAAAWGRRTIQ
jgi:hypothetical protein